MPISRFWDGLDGKPDWTYEDGTHPLTELVLSDYLVVDVTKPYAGQGSYFEIEQAVLEGRPHATCGGRALNDDVMDTIFTMLINAGKDPSSEMASISPPGRLRRRSRTRRAEPEPS